MNNSELHKLNENTFEEKQLSSLLKSTKFFLNQHDKLLTILDNRSHDLYDTIKALHIFGEYLQKNIQKLMQTTEDNR